MQEAVGYRARPLLVQPGEHLQGGGCPVQAGSSEPGQDSQLAMQPALLSRMFERQVERRMLGVKACTHVRDFPECKVGRIQTETVASSFEKRDRFLDDRLQLLRRTFL